jgi:pantoate--beta-alanine ligase
MVTLIQSTEELIQQRQNEKLPVAFVPTMGNLHQGHISLLERALTEYSVVYFSIFVNPKQFGPNEDFNRYPRTLENDLKLIRELAAGFPNSKVIVYHPENPSEVFPKEHNQTISVCGLSTDLEGKIRPGHFDGVTTVVYRLFEIVKPTASYFGLKDYQQYMVIKQMVKDLAMPIKIVGMPIIREDQGLALSSRNQYLSQEQKAGSLILFNSLNQIKSVLGHKKSQINAAHELIKTFLQDKNWNYIEMRDSETFSTDLTHSKNITILAVYQMGTTRLLDNMQVEVQ